MNCLLPDAGAPVYLYEYQYPPKLLQALRPSFVESDHGDELLMVLGFCLTTTHIKLAGKCNTKVCFSRSPHMWGVFGFPGVQIGYWVFIILEACPEEEVQLSRTMMNYWGNFARTG